MVQRTDSTGEFASLDEMAAGQPMDTVALAYARDFALMVGENVESGVSEARLTTTLTVIRPGAGAVFVVTGAEGLEYEVFVRERP
jgi:hypothetical protein